MNNKYVYFLVLCIFSPLIASEKRILAEKQRMIVQMQVNDQAVEGYEIRDVRKIDSEDLLRKTNGLLLFYQYPKAINGENIETCNKDVKVFVTSDSILIKGNDTNQYNMQLTGDSLTNFIKELKKINKKTPKKTMYDDRSFQVSLTKSDMTKGVSFDLTEEDYELIIQKLHQKSYASKIVTIFGFAGLAALIYYFDLHSKCMVFLQRS
ncbi:MAG TPA: hypothetical protein VHX42_01850 [Candidatus Babeliales bacterium]|jgi:hypothetical protein|nr:hypothetical protein [Candidatus Babeliales bacterium]